MKISTQEFEHVSVMTVSGEFTHDDIEQFSRVVSDRCGQGVRDVVLDCEHLEFVDSAGLEAWLREEMALVAGESGVEIALKVKVSGESFLTPPGAFSDLVAAAVRDETGVMPELSTSGGTSDARFVKDHCPVVEFGLVGQTMHAVDERVSVEQIGVLKRIYGRIMRDYFA